LAAVIEVHADLIWCRVPIPDQCVTHLAHDGLLEGDNGRSRDRHVGVGCDSSEPHLAQQPGELAPVLEVGTALRQQRFETGADPNTCDCRSDRQARSGVDRRSVVGVGAEAVRA